MTKYLEQAGVVGAEDFSGSLPGARRESVLRRRSIAREEALGRRLGLRGWGRRGMHVAMASLSLILAAPLLLLAAIAVKLSSPGPVIYSQERVGLERRRRRGDRRSRDRRTPDRRESNAGGRVFRMHKFRTMRANGNGDAERQVWATKDDPRITPVGRVLRAFRFDELPQMVNVLLGDMNIVGPRPEQPEIFKKLRQELADYPRRQHVLPGITGLAQVNHGYDRCMEDVQRKLTLDLDYIGRSSPAEDLKIMLKTVPVVLFRKGGA
ncbi:MAG: sugar transferase [Candidatus Latescibacterota bacterium]|nr:MAG: sugar transferase [Candidatus Latescibacterota bacterium]